MKKFCGRQILSTTFYNLQAFHISLPHDNLQTKMSFMGLSKIAILNLATLPKGLLPLESWKTYLSVKSLSEYQM